MTLLSFFTWCQDTALGETIRTSQWLFPVIESLHLLALAVIGGAVLLVDLRLLGLLLPRQSVARLAQNAQPWLIRSLMAMIATGILLFLSEALKCYYSPAFATKMGALLLATIFTFTIRRRVAMAAETESSALRRKLVALVSIGLWSAVGMGGRWIGFS